MIPGIFKRSHLQTRPSSSQEAIYKYHLNDPYYVLLSRGPLQLDRDVTIDGNPYNAEIFFNSLSPHDALKDHFTPLKTDLFFPQPRVLERKFP